eukprot:gnl/MRDRNA2_/MRDRNA2_32169_c0_seq1.p1 gnl/MRDRNA2_/MRDRNA2_32169_c0~~gnl/MRDRNA2_/MRDRNA2_32169_c0_seq1.p1  ORF type:complete len:176 (+),score=31.45 gnl/MRDRNA2_/MRDRNA2_32169_c0_seq1:16-543(+)
MDKKRERVFNIDLYGLRLGIHNFNFEFDSEIFDKEEDSIVENGNGTCKVILEKSETLINLLFEIRGEVQLTCDRSMEHFMHPLEIKERLILKYGEEFDDTNDEVWVVPENYQTLNTRRNILEFINVAIPMKRLHPKFGEDSAEGMELVYTSEDEEKSQDIDPRWAGLEKLKKSKK